MRVEREDVRKAIVRLISTTMSARNIKLRTTYPGQEQVDVSLMKEAYLDIRILYLDGWATGLGNDAPLRRVGTIVVDANYKSGNAKDLQAVNAALDALDSVLAKTDEMYPVRTGASEFVSSKRGMTAGWVMESLVVPFWYDSPK